VERERLRKIEEERLAAEEKSRLNEEDIELESQKTIYREAVDSSKKVQCTKIY
jgi:cancer susceptibility candidate protein 1